MNTYEKMLVAAAEYEVEQLIESEQEFKLVKSKFNSCRGSTCFYGQVFGESGSNSANEFKKSNNILVGFSDRRILIKYSITALETLLCLLWKQGKKEQVYRIVEKFATWTDETTTNDTTLFTLD